MRISGINITDNDVDSRQAAVKILATAWGKDNQVNSIVSTAAKIAEALGGDGTPSADLGEKVQDAIQKNSSSFLYEEHLLDVGICSAVAMASLLEGTPGDNGWMTKDVYAVALWSSLSFQPTLEDGRREKLRCELLELSSGWSTTSAEKARERANVPDPSTLKITIDDANAVTNNFTDAIKNSINALRRNSALDREELDFLWWAQSGRSRLLKRRLVDIAEPVRILSAGIEGAQLLRRLPCEVNREIVLRTLDQNPEFDLSELLLAIGEERTSLSTAFPIDNVVAHPTIFPLLHALHTGLAENVGASLKRPLSEWGERALLESTFAIMMSEGVGKI